MVSPSMKERMAMILKTSEIQDKKIKELKKLGEEIKKTADALCGEVDEVFERKVSESKESVTERDYKGFEDVDVGEEESVSRLSRYFVDSYEEVTAEENEEINGIERKRLMDKRIEDIFENNKIYTNGLDKGNNNIKLKELYRDLVLSKLLHMKNGKIDNAQIRDYLQDYGYRNYTIKNKHGVQNEDICSRIKKYGGSRKIKFINWQRGKWQRIKNEDRPIWRVYFLEKHGVEFVKKYFD